MVKPITAAWGRGLAAWLRRDKVFRILGVPGDENILCDWQAGGCRLLAECLLKPLQQAFPNTKFILRSLQVNGNPQHVVIRATNESHPPFFIDGDGVSTREELLDRWNEELRTECDLMDYDETVFDIFQITSPRQKRKLLSDLIGQTNLHTFADDPVSTKIGNILLKFQGLGESLNADHIWSCDVGSAVLAYLADQSEVQRAIVQGTYEHPDGASYQRTTGETFRLARRDYPVTEAHTWVVLRDKSGEWLMDPNGEIRTEPRAQRMNARYIPFPPGHHLIELSPEITIEALLTENWDVRLTTAIHRIKFGAPREVEVQILPPDHWSRPRLQNIESHRIYADISLGRSQNLTNGMPGDWHTTTSDGEPLAPLSPAVMLKLT